MKSVNKVATRLLLPARFEKEAEKKYNTYFKYYLYNKLIIKKYIYIFQKYMQET